MKNGGDAKDQQLVVALRVRPISVAELEEGATLIAHKVDEQVVPPIILSLTLRSPVASGYMTGTSAMRGSELSSWLGLGSMSSIGVSEAGHLALLFSLLRAGTWKVLSNYVDCFPWHRSPPILQLSSGSPGQGHKGSTVCRSAQMVVLMDPMEDPDDILRAHRSREKSYLFDVAFDFTSTQEMVYQATTKDLIEGVISGYNATVFAYGPTGCGKTYTMLGTDHEPGIYVRTLNDLFRAIEESSSDVEYEVSMSYLEIYNEMIRDLLNPTLGYLELREDSKGVIQVAGITEVSTINANEASLMWLVMQLLMKGNQQRTQEPTAANQTSSRSHAVLQVAVRQRSRIKSIVQEVRLGRLFMIDLAGSERASQTQNRGQRMKEGAHINRSLLALGNCINALSDKGSNKYVNYRDSKLTRLLKDSLGGNSRTVMIAHISPASTAFEESRNTLTYAGRAKNIKTRVKQNLLTVSYHIAQYTHIIQSLRREIQQLRGEIYHRAGQGRAWPWARPERGDICHMKAAEVQLQAEMRALHEQLTGTFQQEMDARRRLAELEKRATEVEHEIEAVCGLLTTASWKHKKSGKGLKCQAELRKKCSDLGNDILEPPEVASARESIPALLEEQKKLHREKLVLQQHCQQELRTRCQRLEEMLLRLLGSEEQREVLSLLYQLHKSEMENTEAQFHALLRMCDKIIRGQKHIIDDHNLPVPQHLEDLYSMYHLEQEECGLEQVTITDLDLGASRARKDSFLPKITRDVERLNSEGKITTLPHLTTESFHPRGPDLSATSSHSSSANLSKLHHARTVRPRAWPAKSSSVPTPPPIPVGSLVTQEAPPAESLGYHLTSSPESDKSLPAIPLAPKEGKETLTRCVSAKAVQGLSQAQAVEGRHLLASATERSSQSLNSLNEADDAGPPKPTLQHSASENNLPRGTDEIPFHLIGHHQGDGPRPCLGGQKKNIKKKEESLEEKMRKRRSLEVTGQGLSRPKTTHVPRPPESTGDRRVPAYRHPVAGNQHPGKGSLPLAQIRPPPSEGSGSEDTLPLITWKKVGISKRPTYGPHPPHGTSTQDKDGLFRHT
ncbi:Kinesin-like protein KIF19 [Fukomys damarensis]|uniref:Kinesin-like protein KIF19 n=1 Tax=Fukomys damarensis TaxID=885580 RepID=A0A091DJR3_FUKDA|nr:Kinesin-like protein KIF19 [Fukomys damarensis]